MNCSEGEVEAINRTLAALRKEFDNPNFDVDNRDSDSEDEEKVNEHEEFYLEKKTNFGYKARRNVLVREK